MKVAGEESAKADQRDLTSLLRKLLADHLRAEAPPKRLAPQGNKGKRELLAAVARRCRAERRVELREGLHASFFDQRERYGPDAIYR